MQGCAKTKRRRGRCPEPQYMQCEKEERQKTTSGENAVILLCSVERWVRNASPVFEVHDEYGQSARHPFRKRAAAYGHSEWEKIEQVPAVAVCAIVVSHVVGAVAEADAVGSFPGLQLSPEDEAKVGDDG